MSPFFDDLEAQLRAAAEARTEGATRRSPFTRAGDALHRLSGSGPLGAGRRRLPAVAGVLAVIAVVALVLVLIPRHHASSPAPGTGHPTPGQLLQLPPGQLQHLYGYIAKATKPVLASAACRQQRSDTSPIHEAPPAALTHNLAVLRRPATAADVGLPHDLLSGIGASVYAGHVRLATTAAGVRYFVIPALSTPRSSGDPTAHCLALEQQAVRGALPSIPRADRASVQTLMTATIRANRKYLGPGPEVCLAAEAHHSSDVTCQTPRLSGALVGLDQVQDGRTVAMLVPDGARSVSVTFTSNGRRQTVTAPVAGNTAVLRSRSESPDITLVVWRGVDGQVIKRVSPAGAYRQACAREPGLCLLFHGGVTSGQTSSSSSGSGNTAAPGRTTSGRRTGR
jgi:hypothetical protein